MTLDAKIKMNKQATTQIAILKPKGAVVGTAVMTLFVLFFVALAVWNLLARVALIPSLIWLALVVTVLAGIWKEEGTKRFSINILGTFSLKHFAELVETKKSEAVRFGFSALGHNLFYQTIPADKIQRLEWSPGQATSLAGKDMKDWSVVLWFDHDDPVKSEKQKKWQARNPDQDLYIIGPSRAKELTAVFGREILEFLGHAGVALVQADNDCTFIRKSTEMESIQQKHEPDCS